MPIPPQYLEVRDAMRDNPLIPAGSWPSFPTATGLYNPFYQQVQPQQGAATAQTESLGTKILVVLLFRQSIAPDVIPFPKNRPEFGVGRSHVRALVVCFSQLIRGEKA